ncbi:MAG: single-stranded-DNA-specific exonuclease RecJ [Candidatus Edwardsbacteria bacterium]
MERKWILPKEFALDLIDGWAKVLQTHPLIVHILMNRGFENLLEAKNFLCPKLENLCEPFLMNDMEKACQRMAKAISEHQKIMIYGDYDVDGITATALLYRVLKKLGGEVICYLPERSKEGYGLSERGIEEAKRTEVKLLISVDCGITANSEIEMANQLGIDCIITDHHEPKEELPKAIAILAPKTKGSAYPYEDLAGVGVAYKLACALVRFLGLETKWLESYLDLVALGTIADIVPLTGENRIFAKVGLERISNSDNPGIRALIEVSGLSTKNIESGHVIFILAPRINAVGRMGPATPGLRLLLTEDEEEIKELAKFLDTENRRRKELDDQIFSEALKMVEDNVDLKNERVIVLASEEWHQGVIGIVASRLVEQYYRPTVLIALEEERGKGSARSIARFHLHQALKECQEHLLTFGGHKYAAGLTIEKSQIRNFRTKLNEIAKQKLSSEDLIPEQLIDAEIELEKLDFEISKALRLFAPFGSGNRHPVLLARNLEVLGTPYIVGNNHLKFKVKKGKKTLDTIGFRLGELLDELEAGERYLDLAFVLEENEWQGLKKLQLRVKDMKVQTAGRKR